MGTYDILLKNGNIITCDDNESINNWLLIKNGHIMDTGIGEPDNYMEDEIDEIINLNGKTVLPGFYDTHVHLVQTGLNHLGLDLNNICSLSELFKAIAKMILNKEPGSLIRGYHFDVTKINEKRFPTRKELDKISPNNPVWINSIEFHTSALNSLCLTLVDLPYNIDGIARDERNLPLGLFTGKASAFIRNRMLTKIDNESRFNGVKITLKKAISKGVTTIHCMEGGYTFHEKDAKFIYDNKDSFPIDIILYFQTFDIDKIISMNLNRVGGDIFIDGSFGSKTAAISTDYVGEPDNKGKLYFSQKELNYFVKEAHLNNLQIGMHAVGDRAIEQALNAYEYAFKKSENKNNRHRIEHFELSNSEHMKRAAELNLVISVQPAYEHIWGFNNGMYENRLGKKMSDETNNFRKMIDCGLKICGGSDSDITEINPIFGIYCAVNHPKASHSVTLMEALKMFTINGAYSCHEEKFKGSIEKNKLADFIIIDQNPFNIDKSEINSIKVLNTYKEGIEIYSFESSENEVKHGSS